MKELQDFIKQTKSYLEFAVQINQKIQSYESKFNLLKAEEENLKIRLGVLNDELNDITKKKEDMEWAITNQGNNILTKAQEKADQIQLDITKSLKDSKLKFIEAEKKEKEANELLVTAKIFAKDLENRESKAKALQEVLKNYA